MDTLAAAAPKTGWTSQVEEVMGLLKPTRT
jgi:hypothetical protein